MPIFFAFCLNEVGGTRLKKFVQTASYLPHFISWVVAGTMVTTVLGTDGVINDLLLALGVSQTRIQFLQKGEWYWAIEIGVEIVDMVHAEGSNVVSFGEMGIANYLS